MAATLLEKTVAVNKDWPGLAWAGAFTAFMPQG